MDTGRPFRWLNKAGSKTFRWTGWRSVGRGLIILVLLGALVAHAAEGWDVRIDEITIGLLLLIFLVLIGLDRIEELSGPGGLKVSFRQLQAAAEAAKATTAAEDPESLSDVEQSTGSLADDLLELAYQLRNDLAYIREFVLDPNTTPPGAEGTITRLRLDGQLTREEAVLAARVLALADEALLERPLGDTATRTTLDQVREGLGLIKSRVFDQKVREKIQEQEGWTVENFEQKGRHRPDFLAVKGSTRIVVTARTATLPRSKLLRTTIQRMAKRRSDVGNFVGSLIVVPNPSLSIPRGERARKEAKPVLPIEFAKLDELQAKLESMEKARRSAPNAAGGR